MEDNKVILHIEKSGNLPPLPEILLRLLEACDNEESSIGDIAAIINKDPALSLQVLQLVNSAYYGFRHSFSSIEQAVVYLGVKTIKSLALTTSVHQVFEQQKKSQEEQFNTAYFWYHSLKAANIAKAISEEIGIGNGEEAYLAALLHDIGKLVLVATFPENYTLNDAGLATGKDDLKKENELFKTNHCEIGSWLVKQWKLNSLIIDAIQFHHEDLEQVAEAFPLVKIVHVANILAKTDLDRDLADRACKLFFNLHSERFTQCIIDSVDEVEQIADSLGIAIKKPEASNTAVNTQKQADTNASVSEKNNESNQKMIANETIAKRVRNTALLSNFLESLMQTDGREHILSTCEKAITVLLGLDKMLFFLPEDGDTLLQARTSTENAQHHLCKSLTLASHQGSSKIVQAFNNKNSNMITLEAQGESIADQQLLNVLQCQQLLPIPMFVKEKVLGVFVIGFPDSSATFSQEDMQLLHIVVQQVGLKLFIEQENERQAEIVNKERMAAISMTSRKLAHEINNPLGIISNYLVTLKLKLPEDDTITQDIDIIDEEIKRISNLVGQMEMYSQASFTHFQEVDINSILRDIIQLSKASLFSDPLLNLSFIPGSELPVVITSKDAIKQIIINLLKNAAEAMVTGGRVIVRTKYNSSQETSTGQNFVEIIVTDSGPGLPEKIKENLYQPFMTTKQNGHSGLGLSIVQKAVTDIGGRLFCSSRISEGTTFTIALPVGLSGNPVVMENDNEQ